MNADIDSDTEVIIIADDDYRRKATATADQTSALLELLNENKILARGELPGIYAKDHWIKIAEKLNAISGGAEKDYRKWAKFWADLKYLARKKVQDIRKAQINNTLPIPNLNNRDKIILGIIEQRKQVVNRECLSQDSDITLENDDNNTTEKNFEISSSSDESETESFPSINPDHYRYHHVSPKQTDMMLELLKENVPLARGEILGREAEELWTNISDKLNAISSGAKRGPRIWARYWSDMKYRTRKKEEKLQAASANNITDIIPSLTSRDKLILELIGPTSLTTFSEDNSPSDYDDDSIQNINESTSSARRKVIKRRRSSSSDDSDSNATPIKRTGFEFYSDNISSQYLRLQKQTAENTKNIYRSLKNMRADMARMTVALYDLSDYFSCFN